MIPQVIKHYGANEHICSKAASVLIECDITLDKLCEIALIFSKFGYNHPPYTQNCLKLLSKSKDLMYAMPNILAALENNETPILNLLNNAKQMYHNDILNISEDRLGVTSLVALYKNGLLDDSAGKELITKSFKYIEQKSPKEAAQLMWVASDILPELCISHISLLQDKCLDIYDYALCAQIYEAIEGKYSVPQNTLQTTIANALQFEIAYQARMHSYSIEKYGFDIFRELEALMKFQYMQYISLDLATELPELSQYRGVYVSKEYHNALIWKTPFESLGEGCSSMQVIRVFE